MFIYTHLNCVRKNSLLHCIAPKKINYSLNESCWKYNREILILRRQSDLLIVTQLIYAIQITGVILQWRRKNCGLRQKTKTKPHQLRGEFQIVLYASITQILFLQVSAGSLRENVVRCIIVAAWHLGQWVTVFEVSFCDLIIIHKLINCKLVYFVQ